MEMRSGKQVIASTSTSKRPRRAAAVTDTVLVQDADNNDGLISQGDGIMGVVSDPAEVVGRSTAQNSPALPMENPLEAEERPFETVRTRSRPTNTAQANTPSNRRTPDLASGPTTFPQWFNENGAASDTSNDDRYDRTEIVERVRSSSNGSRAHSLRGDEVFMAIQMLSPRQRAQLEKRLNVKSAPMHSRSSSETSAAAPLEEQEHVRIVPTIAVETATDEGSTHIDTRRDNVHETPPHLVNRQSSPDPFEDTDRIPTSHKGKFKATAVNQPNRNNALRIYSDGEDDPDEALREHDRLVALRMQEEQDAEDARNLSQAEQIQNKQHGDAGGRDNDKISRVDTRRGNMSNVHSITRATSTRPPTIPNLNINQPIRPSAQVVPNSIINSVGRPKQTVRIVHPLATAASTSQIKRLSMPTSRDRSSAYPALSNNDRLLHRQKRPTSPSDPSSSDPDTSSPDSSDSETTKKRKKKKKRVYRKALKDAKLSSTLKLEPPKKWSGNPVYDEYETWMFELLQYYENFGVPSKRQVNVLVNFIEGKARRLYMDIVAPTLKQWSLKQVFELFLDELFPTGLRDTFRDKFNDSYQGNLSVKAWAQLLEKHAARLGDISGAEMARQFWNGAQSYLRVGWAKNGHSREFSSFDELREYGEVLERAEQQEKLERSRMNNDGRSKRDNNGAKSGDHSKTSNTTSTGNGNKTQHADRSKQSQSDRNGNSQSNNRTNQTNQQSNSSNSAANSSNKPNQSRSSNRTNAKPQRVQHSTTLTEKQKESLRADDKCFNCFEKGHRSRDCPLKNEAKPSNIISSAINFVELDDQAEMVDQLDEMGSIQLCTIGGFAFDNSESEEPESAFESISGWAMSPTRTSTPSDETSEDNTNYLISVDYFDSEGNLCENLSSSDESSNGSMNWSLVHEVLSETSISGSDDPLPSLLSASSSSDYWSSEISIEPSAFVYTISDGDSEAETSEYEEDHDYMSNTSDWINEVANDAAVTLIQRTLTRYNRSIVYGDDIFFSHETSSLYDTDDEPISIETAIERISLSPISITNNRRRESRKGEGEPVHQLERNAAKPKDFERRAPKPCIVDAFINNNPVRALIDTGSMADFISTTLVDQLKLKTEPLAKPINVQLAVTGSRSKVQSSATVDFKYEDIEERRRFDVMNLDNYDLILGTPFLFQHKAVVGFNPTRLAYGSKDALKVEGRETSKIASMAADVLNNGLERVRELLRKEANDLCKPAEETPLPPFRAINHSIPLKTKEFRIPYIPSRCPDALLPLWRAKRDAYLKSGRWKYSKGANAVPMLFLPKKSGPNNELRLRTVFAKQYLNEHTIKLASPLPDMQHILEVVSKHKYRSSIDGKDAYEQIRVETKDVPNTLFNTPDGLMISLVMQQGDVNASTTYQTLMNHIFREYIGVFLFVYLDDIVIFSNSIEEHVKHVRIVLDILRKERLYLTSSDKLRFFANPLVILGHVIDDDGIRMDPHKVDSIANWKTPTNATLVSNFTGLVQYVARDCHGIAQPLAILSKLQGNRPWKWTYTEERAFEMVKRVVTQWRNNKRVAIDRNTGAPPIGVSVDASDTGAGGIIWQGPDAEHAKVIAFWGGKFNSAEQHYPIHERELLGLVSTLKKYTHLLYGTPFTAYTDHDALKYLMRQKKLNPRQCRWLDLMSQFDFKIVPIPGTANTIADALSRIYDDEPPGVVRAPSEYVTEPDVPGKPNPITEFLRQRTEKSTPLYTGSSILTHLDLYVTTRRQAAALAKEGNAATPSPKSPGFNKDVRVADNEERPKAKDNGYDLFEDEGEDEMSERGMEEEDKTDRLTKQTELPPAVPVLPNDERLELDLAPSLTYVVSEGEPDIRLPECLKDRYGSDSFFTPIVADPSSYKHFTLENGLLFLKDDGRRLLCIPDIRIGERRVREILITHAHSILAHLGARKTLLYLRESVWWKDLQKDVSSFCSSCTTCAHSKSTNHHPYGMLSALSAPSRPWQRIGIDFVGPLPLSSTRDGSYDMICVIIDHLTSMVHLAPMRQTYKAKDVAELVFENVYKLHGLPEQIVSDRDSYFTSIFWEELHRLTGVELRMSTAFHPQTDGATERANRTIITMLRQAVEPDQKDWAIKLPAMEFALNSARSDTTGYSPFFLNSGQMPRPMVWNNTSPYPGVRKHAEMIRDAITAAHDAIIAARVKQTDTANKSRIPAPFTEGDLVYLSTKNLSIPKQRARKLVPKYIGPFSISKVIVPGTTYRLDLPPELKRRGVHPSFHASLLRIHVPNDDRRFPGRSIRHITNFGNPSHWTVDRIVSHSGVGNHAIFEVLWKSGDRSWEPLSHVKDLGALDTYLEALGIASTGQLKRGSGNPPEDIQITGAVVSIYTDQSLAPCSPPLLCSLALFNTPCSMRGEEEEQADWGMEPEETSEYNTEMYESKDSASSKVPEVAQTGPIGGNPNFPPAAIAPPRTTTIVHKLPREELSATMPADYSRIITHIDQRLDTLDQMSTQFSDFSEQIKTMDLMVNAVANGVGLLNMVAYKDLRSALPISPAALIEANPHSTNHRNANMRHQPQLRLTNYPHNDPSTSYATSNRHPKRQYIDKNRQNETRNNKKQHKLCYECRGPHLARDCPQIVSSYPYQAHKRPFPIPKPNSMGGRSLQDRIFM